jgi:hypothetical protein
MLLKCWSIIRPSRYHIQRQGTKIMITDEKRTEWQRLCDAATEGPWTVETPMESPSVIADGHKEVYDWTFIAHIDTGKVKHSVKADRNAAFIAAAREALPALLAENEKLRLNEADAKAERAFKNFHRQLCERFDYTHDDVDWWRDQVSLIEWIAASKRH